MTKTIEEMRREFVEKESTVEATPLQLCCNGDYCKYNCARRSAERVADYWLSVITQDRKERDEEVRKWISKNEYCSMCGSPKKYCPHFGKYPSAIDTEDLLKFLSNRDKK